MAWYRDRKDFRASRFWLEWQKFSFGHVNFEMSVRHPSGDVNRQLDILDWSLRKRLEWREEFGTYWHVDGIYSHEAG